MPTQWPTVSSTVVNMKKYGVPVIVAINSFFTDTEAEKQYVKDYCDRIGVKACFSEVFEKGGEGGIELANLLVDTIENNKSNFKCLYDEKLSIKDKILTIVKEIYGGEGVKYSAKAERKIKQLESLGLDKVPVCMAKTQYSLSDNPALLGSPSGFTVTVSDVNISNGAGFIVALTGDIMTMPGLPKVPAANGIDIAEDGTIVGLF